MTLYAVVGVYLEISKFVNIDLFEKGHYAVRVTLTCASKRASILEIEPVYSSRVSTPQGSLLVQLNSICKTQMAIDRALSWSWHGRNGRPQRRS